MMQLIYIMKIKIHSSWEIECFVETHICKLRVILRSRVLPLIISVLVWFGFFASGLWAAYTLLIYTPLLKRPTY